ncbi:response regulator transcription factor [Albibacterium bauzanense]|uniref:Regulatory LuxR family protein n=1 Tax=Albibacterium bauzanense TaxID=653929 RepID=A0A4R1LWF4_9SPHI|nr:helix-turn-helix transcriptional regulator [Albibacterium bauzanense]TCK83192.1 regulatory LuxR family protein [Albibacterium bauzanense]
MKTNRLSSGEMKDLATSQIFSLENRIANGKCTLNEIGDFIPGSVMVQNLKIPQVTYMNTWGCENLGHSMDEINALGDEYYDKFFVPGESERLLNGMKNYLQRGDQSELYSFFQQVKTGPKSEYGWFYTICKHMRGNVKNQDPTGLFLLSTPMSGMNPVVTKVNKLLDGNEFVVKHYRVFALLTKREKEIISLLTEGKSSPEIADQLFISKHTVSTHRKNIASKLNITSFAELLKFAIAFDLIR